MFHAARKVQRGTSKLIVVCTTSRDPYSNGYLLSYGGKIRLATDKRGLQVTAASVWVLHQRPVAWTAGQLQSPYIPAEPIYPD